MAAPGQSVLFHPMNTAAVGPWGTSYAANLTPAQLGLLALWIDQGANSGAPTYAPNAGQPVPTNVVANALPLPVRTTSGVSVVGSSSPGSARG